MGWLDRLLPGSFRGVPFKVLADSREGGRRLALHEYPLRDLPYAEDLGRKARAFSVQAVVLGWDYDLVLRALTNAMEAEGPGLLTHPSYGLIQVAVDRYQVEISTAEGGMARVSIDFVEAGAAAAPFGVLDTLSEVVDQVAQVWAYGRLAIEVGYRVVGLPGLVGDAASALVGTTLERYDALARALPLGAADRASLVQGVSDDRVRVAALAANPRLVGAALVGRLAAAVPLVSAPWEGYLRCAELAGWQPPPALPATTPARVAIATNQAVLVAAVRDAAIAAAGRLAAAALTAPAVTTAQEICALRSALCELIDTRALVADDGAYRVLTALRVALARDLSERALQAPRRRSVTLGATQPALVLAYRLYGDAGRAGEIERRNRVRHPGFVPGGVPLEVVSG